MTQPPQKKSFHSPRSANDDLPMLTRLTRQVKALEFEVRGLTGQHKRWVERVGHVMCHLDATADKLARITDELSRQELPPSEEIEALIY